MGATAANNRSTQLNKLAGVPEINITPLVDVVLVLLIIFMVVAPAISEGAQIELPKVLTPDAKPKDMDPIEATIAEDGTIIVEDQRIALKDLRPTLERLHAEKPERSLMLKADERSHYKKLRETFAMIQDIGFKGVLLKVVQKQPAGGAS
jgi:biopolymer transport protein ExbD/biopolymer transport protein TolR